MSSADVPAHCHEEHCITCSDEGIPLRVLEIDAATGLARCRDDEGVEADVDVALVESLAAGDAILVHAGVALARLEQEALA